MNGFNEKGERHGPWETCYPNGNLMDKGNFVNGVEHGLSEWYSNGEFYLKEYYL